MEILIRVGLLFAGFIIGALLMAILSSSGRAELLERLHFLQRENLRIEKEKDALAMMLESTEADAARKESQNEILYDLLCELDQEEMAQARLKNPDA